MKTDTTEEKKQAPAGTPRTDAVARMAVGPLREKAILEFARQLERENAELLEALSQIEAIPAAAFTRDQQEMANRTIERMCEIARDANAKVKGVK